MPTSARQILGKWGEDCAARELERRGYAILARRYRTRHGEIDIIARDARVLVFVEVKTRRTLTRGTPTDALTWHKRARLLRLAQAYLATRRDPNAPCRFDVVSVYVPRDASDPRVEVLKSAFDLTTSP
jgi:putative endonuclease